MVENGDVEKKKNDDVESDNVESEDELDDKFAERNEEDDEDVAKDRVEHVMLRIMMSKVMMSKGGMLQSRALRRAQTTATPGRVDVQTTECEMMKKPMTLRRQTFQRAQTTDFDVHRRPFLTCTDDPRTVLGPRPA